MADWNTLTPNERHFRRELGKRQEVVEAAARHAREYLRGHTCRWKEEEPVGQGREPIYPTHPTCLLCDTSEDMELYCHVSPIKVCQFDWKGKVRTCEGMLSVWLHNESTLTLPEQEPMKACPCLHCGDPWYRSY
jgi:hypothetical protein